MKQLFFLSVLFASAFAIDIEYSGNVSLNGNDLDYRKTTWVSSINFAFYSSVEVTVDSNSANANGLIGVVSSAGACPGAYLAFFDVAADWIINGGKVNASLDAAASLIANNYIGFVEVTPDNEIVNIVPFSGLIWLSGGSPSGSGGLRYITFKGTKLLQSLEVDITFVVSDVVGKLSVSGNPIVTPKSMEVIIEIQGYKYSDPRNHIRLYIGVGTASSTVHANGNAHIISTGSGNGAAYFSTNTQAQVDGSVADAKVSIQAISSTDFNNTELEGYINARFGAKAEFNLVSVDFPAGAKDIIYDPSIGVGTSYPEESPASIVRLSLGFLLCLISLALVL